jgi:hypothetical protein
MGLPVDINPLTLGGTGYNINNSLRFRSSAGAYLSRTPAAAGNQQKWTWSGWVKRGQLSSSGYLEFFSTGTAGNNYASLQFALDNLQVYNNISGTPTLNLNTTAVYRDPSAWYHIVVAIDTTQATAANRALLYVNGVQVTSFSTATYPSQNANLLFNASGQVHAIGAGYNGSYRDYFDGYLAEVNFIDGQALTPSSFGAYNSYGVWAPTKYSGTYGTNGFYLNFNSYGSTAALGTDSSGNGNTWTVNNLSVTAGISYDPMTDVPTLTSATVANYPVMNPLCVIPYSFGSGNISNGNLTATATSGAGPVSYWGSMKFSSGLWYWEVTATTINGGYPIVGVQFLINSSGGVAGNGQYSYGQDGYYYFNGSFSSGNGTFTTGDIIMVAYNATNGKLWFGKNGTWNASGNPAAGTNPAMTVAVGLADNYPFVMNYISSVTNSNFGQRPFTYTPPTGYVALNAFNLPAPTIPIGASYMAATTYAGTAATTAFTNTVNGTGLKPDFIWFKDRTTATNHWLINSVTNTWLYSNLTNAEDTNSQLNSFDSNGFTLGTNNIALNASANNYVAWQWKAGGATAVTNTNGSISSQVSASQTAGFSVVTYTGTGANATVGHGLGAAPNMLIVKTRSAGNSWKIYHSSLPSAAYNLEFTTGAQLNEPQSWNSTAPTSTVFSVGTQLSTNQSGATQVAYCWSAVAGYSAFGSYTGNGSTDGPFVYLGFRPRYILWKRTDTASDWGVIDSSRDTGNATSYDLTPNATAAEGTGYSLDFLSNGFKIRLTATRINASGGTYIYAAFAENPFKYALAR